MKIEFFKKKNSFKKKGGTPAPGVYWKYAFLGTFVIMILAFIFSYNLFANINQEDVVSVSSQSGQAEMIDKGRLEKALNYFSDRQNTSTQILSQPAPVVDPSQ
jgi:hypothetical protein